MPKKKNTKKDQCSILEFSSPSTLPERAPETFETDLNAMLTEGCEDPLLIAIEGETASFGIDHGDHVLIDRACRSRKGAIALVRTSDGEHVFRSSQPPIRLAGTEPADYADVIGIVTRIIKNSPCVNAAPPLVRNTPDNVIAGPFGL